MNTATTAAATATALAPTATPLAHSTFPRDAGFSGRDAKNDLMFAATLSVMLAACAIWPIAGAGEVQTLWMPRAAASAQAPVAMARLDTVVIRRSKPAAPAVVAAAVSPRPVEAMPAAPLVSVTHHASSPSAGKTL